MAINNAGIGGKNNRIDQIEYDWLLSDHDPIYNNLYGNIICTREETRYWMKYGNPNATYSIVALSSYNGIRACAGCSLYSISKHGIVGLVESVALEFA